MTHRSGSFSPAQLDNSTPVLLISLADQELRRRDLERRGVPAAWTESYLCATDLREAADQDLPRLADIATLETRLGRAVRPAEIGCALSHRAACRWLSSSGHALALVLEDDIIPATEDWMSQVAATADALTPHANRGAAFICHLGAPRHQTAQALKRRVTWRDGTAPDGTPDLYLQSDQKRELWRAHAYLISRAAAERSSRQETLIKTLADDWNERRRYGWIDEVFFTKTILIGQDEAGPSTIGDRNSLKTGTPSRNEVSLLDHGKVKSARPSLLQRFYYMVNSRARNVIIGFHAVFPYKLSIGT